MATLTDIIAANRRSNILWILRGRPNAGPDEIAGFLARMGHFPTRKMLHEDLEFLFREKRRLHSPKGRAC